jgi:hypothetical protein
VAERGSEGYPMKRVACLLLLLVSPSPCFAKKLPPQPRQVFSPNKAFFLVVDPQTRVHIVYASRDRSRSLWSLSCSPLDVILLSDDGKVVVTVDQQSVRGPVRIGGGPEAVDLARPVSIRFWNRDGVFKTCSSKDLWPDAPQPGPGGAKGTKDPFLTNVNQWDGGHFTVCTNVGPPLTFRFADGAIVPHPPSPESPPLGSSWPPVALAGLGILTSCLLYCRKGTCPLLRFVPFVAFTALAVLGLACLAAGRFRNPMDGFLNAVIGLGVGLGGMVALACQTIYSHRKGRTRAPAT